MDIGWWELFHSKKDNPANLPEARPIEDFWFILKDKVYENDWEANSLNQLRLKYKNVSLNLIIQQYKA